MTDKPWYDLTPNERTQELLEGIREIMTLSKEFTQSALPSYQRIGTALETIAHIVRLGLLRGYNTPPDQHH